jgi:preprotein translocase subunit SecF
MIPNIYDYKHYRYYIIIPVALLLISLYFIPKIQLDSSLKGGVSVQLVTNSTIDPRTLTTLVNAKIPNAQASVSTSPGGLSVTMAENSSLSKAESDLLTFYSAYGNYTQWNLNVTTYQNQLTAQPGNTTVQTLLTAAEQAQQKALVAAHASLLTETADLKPFMGSQNLNITNTTSSIAAWPNIAKNSYSNASLIYENTVIADLHTVLPFSSYSYNEVTPTLGAYFLQQMQWIIIIAFVLVAMAVFFVFRTPVPSFAVVFGAANDILVALGAMAIFGIPLGIASVGGLLMLLGYSIDTDMLSGVRILKRHEGTSSERAFSSFKTGATMTVTAIITFSILFIVSYIAFIPTYLEISGVVLVGLVVDLITTWLADTPMVLWYKQRREGRGK